MVFSTRRLVVIAAIPLAAYSAAPARSADEKAPAVKALDGAAQQPQPDEPKPIKLTLHPARPPAAALEYPLLPRFSEQTPGNAATLYLKAVVIWSEGNKGRAEVWEKIDRWLTMPLAELPRAEVRAAVASYPGVLHNLRLAAHRDHCDWDPPIREDEEVFMILLPEWQDLRIPADLLALKARLETAEGHPAEALATLQTGYAMARHVSDCRFLVAGLVGIALARTMDEQVRTLIESPNCPNLYWSLTALPDPLVDLRPALDFESEGAFFAFPELRNIDHAEHSAAEWDRILTRLTQRYAKSGVAADDKTALGATILIAGEAIAKLPRAKNELVAIGRDRKSVDDMPPSQVILLDTLLIYRQASDEMFKWFNVPYWQGREGFAAFEKRLKTEVREREIIPLASVVLPAISNVRKASVRSQRSIALLRTIEALRFFAAEHDGKLPASLSDIKGMPVPDDPVSGKPFGYKLSGDTAQLDAPPPAGETWQTLGVRYEITMAGKK